MRYNYGRFVEWGGPRAEGLHRELGTKGSYALLAFYSVYRKSNSMRLASIINTRAVAAAKNLVPSCLFHVFTYSTGIEVVEVDYIYYQGRSCYYPTLFSHLHASSCQIQHYFRALYQFGYLSLNCAAEHNHLRSRCHYLF